MNKHTVRATRLALLFALTLAMPAVHGQQVSGLVRDLFYDVPGNAVEDLTVDPRFPDSPSASDVVTNGLEVPTEYLYDPLSGAPIGPRENFGQRLTGYVVAPETGAYTFWIASDDASALYLSTDDSPAHKAEIARVSDWTGFRVWDGEPGQTSAAIPLVTGRRYYIEAIMKQGGGDNHLSVRWQLPSGTVEEPIPPSRLTPSYVPLFPPIIVQQPTNTVVLEGEMAVFRVRAANSDPLHFQWSRSGLPIAGATNASFTNGFASLADQGAQYSCTLTNLLGRTNSLAATLTIVADRTPPAVVSVFNIGISNVQVNFSEPVAEANVATHYGLDGGVTVFAATNAPDGRSAVLTTSRLDLRTDYTLRVSGIYDRAGAANPIPPGTQVTFTAAELASQTIGGASMPNTFTAVGGGYRLEVTGGDVGGLQDQFQFNALPKPGDFDYQVRVQSLTPVDPWAKVGLMARDGLATNSAFAASWATPGIAGCFFQSRASRSATASQQGSAPVNYPYTWLRLRRAGDLFTGFASLDGARWTSLGSATVSMTNTPYLGVAFAGRATNLVAQAEVRDYATVVGAPPEGPLPTDFETLGPSSRRTPVAISEIMYRPAPRADGKSLEYIELFNSGAVPYDLSRFRLGGDVHYDFPAGTKMAPGAFLLVARAPVDVASVYRLDNVLGGYEGNFGNRSGTVRLENDQGAVFLEVSYRNQPPWPVAADGAGHSLVLARPSFGEGDSKAWAASRTVGGSPGGPEVYEPEPRAAVVINEILASAVWPALDFVELYNHSTNTIDLSGCGLSDDPTTNKFVFGAGSSLAPRGYLALNRNQLGFGLSSGGETVYLTAPRRERVLEAVRFGASAPGISQGRFPDGDARFRLLDSPTPGLANRGAYASPVTINEIMFDPPSGDAADTYVELHNPGTNSVDVSGWKLVDGVSFTAPSATVIPAGGYLVIGRDAAHLQSVYTNLNAANLVGDFSGNLSRSGERLALAMPVWLVETNAAGVVSTHPADVVVNEVTYGDGGRWGRLGGRGRQQPGGDRSARRQFPGRQLGRFDRDEQERLGDRGAYRRARLGNQRLRHQRHRRDDDGAGRVLGRRYRSHWTGRQQPRHQPRLRVRYEQLEHAGNSRPFPAGRSGRLWRFALPPSGGLGTRRHGSEQGPRGRL